MSRLLVAGGLILAASAVMAAELGFPLITTYGSREVGTEAMGHCAVQAADGMVYIGGNSLLSCDGDRWRSYPVAGSYGIMGLDLAPDGRLWTAAAGEIGWFERNQGGWVYHSLRSFLPAADAELGPVTGALAFGDGAVFTTPDRLVHWDGTRLRVWRMPDSRRVRAFRSGGEILIQHQPVGLYAMRSNGPELVVPAKILGTDALFQVERRGDHFRIVNSLGIFDLHDGKLEPIGTTGGRFIHDHKPTTVVELRDGRLAVGTLTDGLALIGRDGDLEAVIGKEVGLDADYVVPLLCDRDGALWAGSKGAIFHIPIGSRSSIFDRRAGVPLQPVVKLGRYAGQVALANTQGIYLLDPATRLFSRLNAAGDARFDFAASPGELITVGYRSVTRIASGAATVPHETTADVTVIEPFLRQPGHFLIGEGRNILDLSPDGGTHLVAEGLPDYANSIAEGADGSVWIGTKANGIFVHEGPGVGIRSADEEMGLPNPRANSRVIATGDRTIVAFTRYGASMRKPASNRFVPIANAPARPVVAAAVDAAGSAIWTIHQRMGGEAPTIGRLSFGPSGPRWQPHAVEGLDHVGVPRSIFIESRGAASTLWIGGTEGVLRHEFSGEPIAPAPRAPLVQAIARTRNGGRQVVESAVPLGATTQSIAFEFSAPDFGRRAALQLQTWIEPIDSGWVTVGAGAHRELNGIGSGDYRVRARAVAEPGAVSPETTLTFKVLKPWWLTMPALGSMAVAIVLLATGAYQLRVRSLRRRNAELEEKVRVRTEELERASAAKTEFVANMSHDIRNPLNGIIGMAIALEDTRLDPRQQEIVATLRECTTYLSTLVDDVLDFASIEAGRVELRSVAFSPQELLGSIVETLKTDAIQSGARFEVAVDPQLPAQLVGDAGRIQQILVNYVSNALKYAGGRIRITAEEPANAPGEIEFAVADQGPGLNEAEQAVLFTKFARSAQARQLAIPGTGLGLAACRLLADIMGGSVGVTSQAGQGARFFLRLPKVVAAETTTEPVAALPNSTVLLVEDTDYNAWAAKAVLSRLGLGCERARDGAEALRLFAEKRFNVVLLDRNLPDMDGTEVARRIRRLEGDGTPSVLLAITAYCTAEDRARCLEAGMDAFVGKPLTPEKLRKALLGAAQRALGSTSIDVSAEVASPPQPKLDTTLLSYLGEDTPSGLRQQIERLVGTMQRDEEELGRTVAAGDAGATAELAHRVLGHARMVGSSELAAAALALERAARQGEVGSWPVLLADLGEQIDCVTGALRRHPGRQTA